MTDAGTPVDYSVLDRPEILMFLFHPRKEGGFMPRQSAGTDVSIPVETGVSIGGNVFTAYLSYLLRGEFAFVQNNRYQDARNEHEHARQEK